MPTTRPHHTITETPRVRDALAELVVRGAQALTEEAGRHGTVADRGAARRARLAGRLRRVLHHDRDRDVLAAPTRLVLAGRRAAPRGALA